MKKPLQRQAPGLQAAIIILNNGKSAGGISRLAEELGISRSAISQWRDIPLRWVPQVTALTGLTKEVLRPDFFAPAAQARKRTGKSALAASA